MDDFDTIESVIKDHIIPISLSRDERIEPLLGIQPSFTMMNREYLSMKVMATRWLKSRDFVVDDRVEIGNGLYIDYYTEFDDEWPCSYMKKNKEINSRPGNMVSKLFAWHNAYSSFSGKRHIQFMAMCSGPDIKSGSNILCFGLNIKDIHITTGRLGAIDLIESKPGVMSESFDSAQPDVKLILETCALPRELASTYKSVNNQTSRYIQSILPSLKPLDQVRVDRLNAAMIEIANDSSKMITQNGFQFHREGVLSGDCLTIWNNTVDLNMVFLQNALDNKIKNHYGCPADSFGLVMSCLKICGVGIDEVIDANTADSFMRAFPCYVSTAITYASDLKKDPNTGSFEMSEDISTPMSDNVYEDKAYSAAILKRLLISRGLKVDGAGLSGFKRSYHDSIFYDDCEGDASILKICFGMAHRFCQSASRISKACDHEKLAGTIKSYSIMQDWSLEDIRKGLVQCKQLYSHIKDSSIQLLLMSAKAPNVEKSSISNGDGVGYEICGHCAAMTSHKGNLYLAEMTAPVYMLSLQSGKASTHGVPDADLNKMKRSYNKVIEMKKMMKELAMKNKASDDLVTEDLFYSQLCNDCAPDIGRSKVWLHMKDLDGVFWHIGGILGDKMLMLPDTKTVGIPVSELIKPGMAERVKAIKINQSKEEMDEFNLISTYATPPILPYIKVFQKNVSPPLKSSIYPISLPTIPLVYGTQKQSEAKKLDAWVKEEPTTRFTCTIGNKLIAVQVVPRMDLKEIENHSLPVNTKFCLH
ncbi:hypothetical protein GUITHDRAFT_146904 [Guillardia theta CCMP2712]|uniref:Uncharacterized protein n=1 Tax=Guillardia theta (strain CCMP2712) TaxID=905079 RepID=L1IFR5_GUITC|nr:hypothetical protein GUITHDRAFT_146904 [Guillardia theta CCMP2712]EKX34912.1 hypothetical protein GUITHDRAFT_146904 [Guillardia theta CCMP2712]|eukprot:XP_005821892.1 hypothetical protein GUITHDRAFT_146904 [Guillardia theta CCMP2712]